MGILPMFAVPRDSDLHPDRISQSEPFCPRSLKNRHGLVPLLLDSPIAGILLTMPDESANDFGMGNF